MLIKMKKRRILFVFLVGLMIVYSLDTYSQTGKVPRFQIIQANGKLFKAQDLPIGKPIVLIYFSPECEECQKFTEALLLKRDDFWKASIVMVTYLPVEKFAPYITKYKLNIYPNIFVGTEGNTFIVRYFYNITRFPFVALYNKNGDLIKIWDKKEDIEDLSNRLKDL
jgi:thiol-disulfide isomerase/thioredoxin